MFLRALSPTTLSLSLCSLSHQLKNSSFLQVHHRDHCLCPANQANMDRVSVQFGRSGWGAVKGCLIMPYRSRLLLGRRAMTNLCCALLSASVMSDSLQPHGLQPTRHLCPWAFSKQEHWNGLPCPPPGHLPNPGIEPRSPTLHGRFFTV